MKPIEVNEKNFSTEVIRSPGPVVVNFWADSCVPCKEVALALEEIAAEQSGRLKLASVNVDNHPDLAERFHVESLPTLLFFANGLIWHQMVGLESKDAIRAAVADLGSAGGGGI